MKRLFAASLVAAALGAAALPAAAHANVEYIVNVPPPPVRYEPVVAPRVGYVWVPGYWDWRHGCHYWVRGQYVRHRHGYVYEPARWAERDGRWHYARPAWRAADRDGDGVPNRLDRFPDNPYRH